MRVIPIAFDSFGVRSMCTIVKLKDIKILIDPGVALGPRRYGLPPTEAEWKMLEKERKLIIEKGKDTQIIFVSHYHYDHHPFPDDDEMYSKIFKEKLVLTKNPTTMHYSGKRRGKIFLEKVNKLARQVEIADGKTFEFDNFRINVSPEIWHGEVNSKVGKVIALTVEEKNKKFFFGSDAQSLADPKAKEWFIKENPTIAIIDGYPTIFIGFKFSKKQYEKAKMNLKEAIEKTNVKKVVLEHHLLRDKNYEEKILDLKEFCEEIGCKLLTAAELIKTKNNFLEAWREELTKSGLEVDVEKTFKRLMKRINKLLK